MIISINFIFLEPIVYNYDAVSRVNKQNTNRHILFAINIGLQLSKASKIFYFKAVWFSGPNGTRGTF